MTGRALILSLLAGAVLMATGPARAEMADQAVQRYMKATTVGCYDVDQRRAKRCPLARDGVIAGMGEGTFPGEERKVLLAIFAYPNEDGGNSFSQHGAVFVEQNGRYAFVRRLDAIYGSNFRDFRFVDAGKVQVTATVPRKGDPRCCPTGTEIRTIDIGSLPRPVR